MHIFACILLQPDEGGDDKFKARRVSCCSNCFCLACYCTLMVAIFSLNVYVLRLLMFVTMYA